MFYFVPCERDPPSELGLSGGLHRQRQGQEGIASRGDVAALHLLLKHEEMAKSSVLSFSVPSPACLRLPHGLSVCLSLSLMRCIDKSFGKRQDKGSKRHISVPSWISSCKISVNFYCYYMKSMLPSIH